MHITRIAVIRGPHGEWRRLICVRRPFKLYPCDRDIRLSCIAKWHVFTLA